MRWKFLALGLIFCLTASSFSGCRFPRPRWPLFRSAGLEPVAAAPAAAEGRRLRVDSANFIVHTRQWPIAASYALHLTVKELQGTPIYLVVEYQNPKWWGRRLIQHVEVEPWDQDVILESEPMGSFKKNRKYKVRIRAYADPEHTSLVDTLTQTMRSQLEWNLLRRKKIAR